MTSQVIRTVLETDATRAVAGFAAGEKAVAGYERALTSAQRAETGRGRSSVFDDVPASADKAQSALTRLSGSVRDNRAAWDDLSSKAMIGGAAVAIGLGGATKAAIGWESAWAGVKKTTDGTPEQMAALEGELRELARTLPATHEEIAGVAEAAGQLGVARKDIAGFTETAIALGESTNLSAEEAATGLAKISNVMGTMDREGVKGIERMGSALVALGNDGASTEADILAMAQRLSGAGKMIGATESDILAMSSALSSVGIEAELGGGAMSRALQEMNSAVIGGGKELEGFAEVAGMSAREFAAAWRDDPIAAANAFISGLGGISESGGDAAATLSALGLGGTQNAQVLLRAAGASDLLTDSLKVGADAYRSNNALMDEANQRYATTESRLQVAKNTMKDAAIDAGSVLGPALASVAEKAAGAANAFVQMPKPLQQTATGLAGVAASALLIGGGAVKVIGWGQDIAGALDTVGVSTRTADGDMTRFGRTMSTTAKWGGYAVGILAVATAIGQVAESANDAPASIEATTSAILDMRDAAKGDELAGLFDNVGDNPWLGNFTADIDNLAEAYKRLNDPYVDEKIRDWKDNLFPGLSSEADQVEASFNQIGEALAQMPADEAARSFEQMVTALGGGQEVRDNLLQWMPAYRDALTGASNDARLAGDGANQMGGDLTGLGTAADDAGASVEDLASEIKGLGSTFLDEREAARSYQEALDTMRNSIRENGSAWGTATEAGRANMEALEGVATAARDSAAAIIENGGSVKDAQAALSQGRRDVDRFASSLNVGKSEARQLKDEVLKLPPETKMKLDAPGAKQAAKDVKDVGSSAGTSKAKILELDTSIRGLDGKTVKVTEEGADASQVKVRELDGALLGLPGHKKVQVTEVGSTAAGEMVVEFKDKVYAIPASRTAQIRQEGADQAKGRVMGLNESIRLLNGKTVKVGEDGAQNATGRVRTLDGSIFGLKGKTVKVEEIGATASGQRVVSLDGKIYALSGKTVDARANVSGQPQVDGLRNSIGALSDKTVTVTSVVRRIGANLPFAEGGFNAPIPMASGDLRPPVAPGLYGTSRQGILMAEDTRSKWEAYIPERPDLRGRAEAILEETARRFGKAVIPLEGITAMASGGVYSRWRSQLAAVNRLSNRYRWEDGSRQIQVFEDGTARWRGYGAAPAGVAQAIAALNAAQDAYEDALNAKSQPRQSRYTGQHSQAYYDTLARWAANKGKSRYTGQHSDYYYKKQAEWAAIRKQRAAGGRAGGGAFMRSTPSPHEGRTYVAPAPRITSGGSSSGGTYSGSITEAGMERAITSAFSRVKVVTTINGRDFAGVIQRTAADRKGR